MENIEIVRVTVVDIDALENISRQTFTETFSAQNTEENLTKYLDEHLSKKQLDAELRDPNVQFYFAKFQGEVIGYLKLNSGHSQTELRDENGLEIERIYVVRAFLGKAVGQMLFHKALEVGTLLNARYVWLGVWEENHRAISFYRKNGFVSFGKHIFKLGDDEQTDILMKIEPLPADVLF